MKFVGKCSISKKKAKEGFEYPIIRLPREYSGVIGREAKIYEIDENRFLVLIDEGKLNNQLDNPCILARIDKNLLEKARELGIDISSFIEEKLTELLTQRHKTPRPGIEPGSRVPETLRISTTLPGLFFLLFIQTYFEFLL
mgnify:CR=1 FL=1